MACGSTGRGSPNVDAASVLTSRRVGGVPRAFCENGGPRVGAPVQRHRCAANSSGRLAERFWAEGHFAIILEVDTRLVGAYLPARNRGRPRASVPQQR